MNKEKLIKFLWISMWLTLLLMVLLKLTFNYYYPIVIENSKLLTISKYIDEHVWLLYPLNYLAYMCDALLISLCVLHEKWFRKKWHIIVLAILFTIAFPFKYINTWITFAISLIPIIVVPCFITKQKRYWIFIAFGLMNLFQILSNLARGNPIINSNTYTIELFMGIDYYIMFIIYYIGGCIMGANFVLPWFTKKETVINAKIEKLQKKIKKLEDKKQCLKKQ